MVQTSYIYSKSLDFPGGSITPTQLKREIDDDAGVTTPLDFVLVGLPFSGASIQRGSVPVDDEDRVDIVFNDAATAGELTVLDADTAGPAGGLIAAHPQSTTPNDPPLPSQPGDSVRVVSDGGGGVQLPPIDGSQLTGLSVAWPFGKTHTVDPSNANADFSTIGAAITAATDGDTILIAPGDYAEVIGLTKALRFVGFGRQHPNGDGSSSRTRIRPAITTDSLAAVWALTSSEVVLENIEIAPTLQNPIESGTQAGIFLVAGSMRLVNCAVVPEVADVGGSATSARAFGIQQSNATSLVLDNTFVQVNDPGDRFSGGIRLALESTSSGAHIIRNDSRLATGTNGLGDLLMTASAGSLQLESCRIEGALSLSGSISSVSVTGGTQILGTITDPSNEIDCLTEAGYLRTSAGRVDVRSGGAPSLGQVLTAQSGTTASWQDPLPRLYDAVIPDDYASPGAAFAVPSINSVFVRDGVHTETQNIVIPPTGTLVGASVDGAIIDLSGGFGVVLDGSGTDYSDGTISVTNGATAVVGVGTTFQTAGIAAGDWILIGIGDKCWTQIESVDSETGITLANPWQGQTVAGGIYEIKSFVAGLSIANLTLRDNASGSGIDLTNVIASRINDVIVSGCGQAATSAAVMFDNLTDSLIRGLQVIASAHHGIEISGSYQNTFDSFNVKGCNGHGVLVTGGNQDVTFSSGNLCANDLNGFNVTGGADETLITNCVLSENNGGGCLFDTGIGDAHIRNSTIRNNNGFGVDTNAGGWSVQGCQISSQTTGYGVIARSGGHVGGCMIRGNAGGGINVLGDNILLDGSRVFSNTGDGITIAVGADDTRLSGLVVFGNSVNQINDSSTTSFYEWATKTFEVYEAGGNQSIGGGPTIVQLDTVRTPVDGLALVSNQISVTNARGAGRYKVDCRCSADAQNRTTHVVFLALNGTEIPGTRGAIYERNTTTGGSGNAFTEVVLDVGDTLDMRAVRIGGSSTMTIYPNTPGIIMQRVGDA